MTTIFRFLCLFFFATAAAGCQSSGNWRSVLYPNDWTPGFRDAEGRFLHDFSYAGYRSGMQPVPDVQGPLFIDVTAAEYGADHTGRIDATGVLQRAIDDAGAAGGGVVYLPEGIYRVSVPLDRGYGLRIDRNNVVIRGAGAGRTMICNVSTFMRNKNLFEFTNPEGNWARPLSEPVLLTEDVRLPTRTLKVSSAESFRPGDAVVVTFTVTEDFIAEHRATGYWNTKIRPQFNARRVTAVDPAAGTITIDVPTRYLLLTRDSARVCKVGEPLSECGLEHLSIGNVQHPTKDGWENWDYLYEGRAAYDVHQSHMISFRYAENCWVRDVATYRPEENPDEIHVLSNALILMDARLITVESCDLRHSQYEGAGGNGYMYTLVSNDCLVTRCHAEHGRHHYDFKWMTATGNVIHRCTSKEAHLASDFHMLLSVANLFDCMELEGDYIDAQFRPYGSFGNNHMYSATQCVIWNTKSVKPYHNPKRNALIYSMQYGHGYVIGTSGVVTDVATTPISGTVTMETGDGVTQTFVYDTSPEDWAEGAGRGETLVPQSLYEDQLARRKAREK